MGINWRRRFWLTAVGVGCLWLVGAVALQAQSERVVVLTDGQGEYPLGTQVDYVEDVTGSWTVEEVAAFDGRFQPHQANTPNFGITHSVYWLRFQLRAEVERPSTWWLEIRNATLDQIDLYVPDNHQNSFTHQQAGSLIPSTSQAIFHHYPVFALDLVPFEEKTIYLRVRENANLLLPLTLFTTEALIRDVQIAQLIFGLNFGALIVMAVYNLFLYLFLRQRSYLYYVAYIVGYILGQATNDGLTRQYLWPDAAAWNDLAGFLLAPLTVSSFLAFTDEFLQTRRYVPGFYQLKKVLISLWGLLFVLVPFVNLRLLTPPLLGLLFISGTTASTSSFLAWRRGYRPARYFLMACSLPLVGVMIFALARLGILPLNVLTEQSVRMGTVSMVALFSVALADQINMIRRQKEAALNHAEQLNQELEARVMARTAELVASNQHLKQLVTGQEQAEAALRQQASQLNALREIALEITAELELRILLQSIITRAAELVKTNRGGLFLWQPEREVLEMVTTTVESALVVGTVVRPGEGLAGSVWVSGQPLMTNDYQQYLNRIGEIAAKIGQAAIVCIPVRWREEQIGVLAITDRSGRHFSDEDVALLELFASQAAVAIQNARLLAQTQSYAQTLEAEIFERRQAQDVLQHYRGHLEDMVAARTAELEAANQQLAQHNQVLVTLHAASLAVTSSLNLQQVLNTVTWRMAQLLNVSICDVLTWDEQARTMTMVAGYRTSGQLAADQFMTYDLSRYPLSERVLMEKIIVQMTISQPDLDPNEREYMEDEDTKMLLMLPILFHNHSIGMITLEDHEVERVFTQEEIVLAQLFSYQAANAIENARYYAQAQRLITELEAKNAELERFTYTVSHDLKSPLVTVRGFLGFLERDALKGDKEGVKRDVVRIREATRRMEQLLNDLLELSRIGRLVNPPQKVPFNVLVEEALALVAGRIEERQVQVEVAPQMPVVEVDQPRLVEVLQNLIDNGVKFMGNQPAPKIEIGTQEKEGETIFFVKDNGIGIPPQYHDKVFGLFDRLDSTVEGTGIGLALVKRIVEVHNGRIWIETSAQNPGTVFCFTLPLA